MNQTTITTKSLPEGLTLRPLRVSDAEQFHALKQQPAVFHANPHMPYRSLESTRDWIEKFQSPSVAIAAVIGETLIGEADLVPGTTRRAHAASVGLSVHEAWQGRGIGTRLMAELIDVADNWLGLRRLELQVFTDNDRAIALYRKFGFEIEARHRGSVQRDGMLADSYLMARIVDPLPMPEAGR